MNHCVRPCALAAIGFAFLTLVVPIAHAGDKGSCNTAANVTSDVWQYAGPIVKSVLKSSGPQAATAAQVIKATEQGIKAWNKLAKNSWARIGPRSLENGKTHKGRVIGITERLFVSPIIGFGKTKVKVKKVDGKGNVRVVICVVGENNKATQVRDFYLNKDTKNNSVKTTTVDAAGKLIKVVFHGKNVTKSIKYELTATPDKDSDKKSDNTRSAKRTPDNTHSAKRAPRGGHTAPRTPAPKKPAKAKRK